MSKPPPKDNVNQPDHYTVGGHETIDVIEAKMGGKNSEWVKGYYLGNVMKYVQRAHYKGKMVEDLKKAQYYLNRLVDCFEDELVIPNPCAEIEYEEKLLPRPPLTERDNFGMMTCPECNDYDFPIIKKQLGATPPKSLMFCPSCNACMRIDVESDE